jgi:hypothetical protein
MDGFEGLEQRVSTLEKKFAAAQRLGELDFAEIKANIAVLAAQVATFEQRSGKRFLGLETRIANVETRLGSVETVQGRHTQLLEQHTMLLEEILRRLPERA